MTHQSEIASTPLPAIHHQGFEVIGLPAFNDNYIWILITGDGSGSTGDVVVVDPGDAAPVIDYCRHNGLLLTQIWLTHHHADHTGGVSALRAWVSQSGGDPVVYGPAIENIPGVDQPLQGGEQYSLSGGLVVQVLSVPGHTCGHLAYLVSPDEGCQPQALFCGDLLFGLGCGRLFEGTPVQMFESLARIRALRSDTLIYCAHEYTLLNLPFALSVDPANGQLQNRAATIRRLRQSGLPTVPLTLAEELATNPLLRAESAPAFASLRTARDGFKAREPA